MKADIQLTVYSDFNCPWCYVAHKEIINALGQARAQHPDLVFKLEYRPYEIDPTLPVDKPMCRIACYMAKFGCESMKEKVQRLLTERGKEVGIDL